MGRSGHHSSRSHHSYRSHRSYGSRGTDMPLWVYIAFFAFLCFISVVIEVSNYNQIKGKERINSPIYVTNYLYDEVDYFDDSQEEIVIEGMQYFFEKTGVQPVIYTTHDYVTEKYVTELYYEMFKDEAHILIALPIVWGQNQDQYYYIGDDSETIITEVTMNNFFERIDSSWSGKCRAWSDAFKETAELILSD